MILVVDASVACKWFLSESLSPQALSLRDSGTDLLAPDFILIECANAAWRRVVSGMISFEQARAFTRALPRWFENLTPAAELHVAGLEFASMLNHPVYDCMYLALAQRESSLLVTADSVFVNKVRESNWAHLVQDLRQR